MANGETASADQELATALALWNEADDAIRAIVHEGLLEIRNSRDVAGTRVDVMLQAAVAAVEQVQDVRIDLLENPEANYSSFVVEVLVTIAFETTLAGVVLSKISGALFSHIMSSVALRMRRRARGILARSDVNRLRERMRRLQLLRDLPRMRSGAQRTTAINELTAMATARGGRARQLLDGYTARQPSPPSPASNSREALRAFHEAIRTMARGGGDVSENLQGVAQTAIVLADPPSAGARLSEDDSPGVRLLTDVQAYVNRTRLAIALVHNELEKWMMDQLLQPDRDTFLEILSVCTYRDVRAGGNGDIQRIDDDLRGIRDQYRALFEAVIWAHLFGFHRWRSVREPEKPTMSGDTFARVDDRLMSYWLARFGPQIDARNADATAARRFPGRFKDLNKRAQAEYLREHFWRLIDGARELESFYMRQQNATTTQESMGRWW